MDMISGLRYAAAQKKAEEEAAAKAAAEAPSDGAPAAEPEDASSVKDAPPQAEG